MNYLNHAAEPFVRALCVALFAMLLSACGSVSSQMARDMEHDDYASALARSEQYLEKHDDEHRDYQAVQENRQDARRAEAYDLHTASVYRSFIDDYPNDSDIDRVRDHYSDAYFEDITRRQNTLEAYRQYLWRFPDGRRADDARARSARLAWRATQANGTVEALRAFRREYEGHPLADAALLQEVSIEWARIERAGAEDVAELLEFAESYEGTQQGEFAFEYARSLQWQSAEAEHTARGYLAFVDMFPGSIWKDEALRRAEEIWWEQALAANTVQGYRDFLEAFPESDRAHEAYAREANVAFSHIYNGTSGWDFRRYFRQYADTPHILALERLAAGIAHRRNVRDAPRNGRVSTELSRTRRDSDGGQTFFNALNGRREYIPGLSVEDVRVFEGPKSQQITTFLGMESIRPLDLVFVVDASGSMGDDIAAVNASAVRLAETLLVRQRDARFGLVVYGDTVVDSFGKRRMTEDVSQLQSWLTQITTDAGGNENPVAAIEEAMTYRFRRDAERVVVLITDEAPNQTRDPRTGTRASQLHQRMNAESVLFYGYAPQSPHHSRWARETGGLLIHHNGNSGTRQQAHDAMMTIAEQLSSKYEVHWADELEPGSGPLNARNSMENPGRDDELWRFTIQEPAIRGHGGLIVEATRPTVWVDVGDTLDGQLLRVFNHESDPAVLLAATRSGVYRTADMGRSWERIVEAPLAEHTVAANARQNSIWILVDGVQQSVSFDGEVKRYPSGQRYVELLDLGSEGVVPRDTQGGLEHQIPGVSGTWPENATSNEQSQLGRDGALLVLDDTGTLLASDRMTGEWVASRCVICELPDPNEHELRVAAFSNGLRGLGESDGTATDTYVLYSADKRFYRSFDGGVSWHEALLPEPIRSSEAPLVFTRLGQNRGTFCVAAGQSVFCTEDGGVYYKRVVNGLVPSHGDILGLAYSSTGLLAATESGDLLRLYDVASREYVAGGVYFATGSAEPQQSLLTVLEARAQLLTANRTLRLHVEGHTDDRGGDNYNLDLSRQRAERVRELLIQYGALDHQVTSVGYGEDRPVAPNNSTENRARNRRVELMMMVPQQHYEF